MSNQSQGKSKSAFRLFKTILRRLKFFTAQIPGNRVLNFPSAQAFGRYDQFFPPDAVAHPAKANSAMIEWIILRYTKAGDVVVDPMAGTFSTCVIAAINNRHGIGAELEDKFHRWGLEAKQRVERTPTFTPKGRMVVLKGDARELSKVLKENADAVVFSPPFGTSQEVSSKSFDPLITKKGTVRGRGFYSGGGSALIKYSQSPENIGNLPYVGGGIDVVLFSPPFTNEPFADKKFVIRDRSSSGPSRYADFGPGDIGGLPYGTLPDGGEFGVDAIITSPPYSGQVCSHVSEEKRLARIEKLRRECPDVVAKMDKVGTWENINKIAWEYSRDKRNIGNLPHGNADAIVSSPPYENQAHDTLEKRESVPSGKIHEKQGLPVGYSENPHNIGNLKANTYLGAMLQVYRECYKVLKPGGVMVLITKNFIRNKKIVRLDLDTIKLCESVLGGGRGFKFVERWYRKLEHPSFWRIIYSKKFHYCPQCAKVYRVRKATTDKPSLTKCPRCNVRLNPAMIDVEDILVFRKPEAEK